MEKFIHTLGSINYYCSTLYKNVAVCYLDGFFFYDLGTDSSTDRCANHEL